MKPCVYVSSPGGSEWLSFTASTWINLFSYQGNLPYGVIWYCSLLFLTSLLFYQGSATACLRSNCSFQLLRANVSVRYKQLEYRNGCMFLIFPLRPCFSLSPHSTDVFICTSPIKHYKHCPHEKVSTLPINSIYTVPVSDYYRSLCLIRSHLLHVCVFVCPVCLGGEAFWPWLSGAGHPDQRQDINHRRHPHRRQAWHFRWGLRPHPCVCTCSLDLVTVTKVPAN